MLDRPYHRHLLEALTGTGASSAIEPLTPANRCDLSTDGEPFVGTVAVGCGPIGGIAVSADGGRLVVSNYGDDSVSVIDTGTGTVVHTTVGTGEPFAVATGTRANSDFAGRAYVGTASAAFDSVVAVDIDTADVVASYPVAFSIADLVADPAGRRVYVTRSGSSGADVLAIDVTQGPIGTTDLATTPGVTTAGMCISPDGRQLYVAVQRPAGDAVLLLDSELNLLDVVGVSGTIRDIAISPDGGTVFIAGSDHDAGGVVEVIDTHTMRRTERFAVGALAAQLTVSADGDRIYLIGADGVVVACTRTHRVVGAIGVPGSPSCAVESPDGARLYIADHTGAVTAVSVASPAPHALDDAVAALLELEPAAV